MQHHLPRLLLHRLLLLRSVSVSSPAAAAAFSTAKRPYARRPKPPPAAAAAEPTEQPAGEAGDDAPAGAGAGAAWQREKLPGELPRPAAIPFQPRVANAVRLVGTVGAPVQMQRTADGRFSAVSVLVQERCSDFPKFWIPIIFQDDLAQLAAAHLKENDLVFVSGQLTCDVPPFKLSDGQANIQVVAQSLSFVDSKVAASDVTMDEDQGFMGVAQAEKRIEANKYSPKYAPGTVSGYKSKEDKLSKLWNDVVSRPLDWIDNRPQKKNGSINPKCPDFKNKVSREGLWLNTAPITVREKLDNLVFSTGFDSDRKDGPFGNYTGKEDLWRDLLDNPGNWWDNRSDKPTPKYPDFKHKESGQPLWIRTKSPQWAIDALPSLKFNGASKGPRKQETLLS
ncbi:hypothetical protein ACP4OV_019926 [Aristida adscensionis]